MTDHQERPTDEAYQAALLDAVETPEPVKEEGRIHLSTGVILGVRPFPKLFIKRLYDNFEKTKPKIPLVMNEQKSREELNPADPDYLEALQKHEMDLLFAVNDLAVMKGTYLVHKPDDIPAVEDDSWVEEQEYFGIKVPKNKSLRYLAWVSFVAAPADEDHAAISRSLSRYLGVTEEAVAREMNNFPGGEEREADLSGAVEVPAGDWD